MEFNLPALISENLSYRPHLGALRRDTLLAVSLFFRRGRRMLCVCGEAGDEETCYAQHVRRRG